VERAPVADTGGFTFASDIPESDYYVHTIASPTFQHALVQYLDQRNVQVQSLEKELATLRAFPFGDPTQTDSYASARWAGIAAADQRFLCKSDLHCAGAEQTGLDLDILAGAFLAVRGGIAGAAAVRELLAARAGAAVRYGPINAGLLPAAIANTFRGGSYTATTLSEGTTLYRAYGGTAGQLGSFWTRTPPSGALQSTIDLALKPQWGNTAVQVAKIRVPAGTTIFEGAAAGQGGLVGGGSQVFIPTVNPAWIIP
jgi:hypothetical protein